MSAPAAVPELPDALTDLPLDLLNELDRNLNAVKWTVPIKSDGALPVLLTHAIRLAIKGSPRLVISAHLTPHRHHRRAQSQSFHRILAVHGF